MSHKHTKKDKKHHHHNNNVAPSCIMAEKKGGKKKGKSNDKRHKKKTDSLRRAKSGTRLHDFFSKTNILLTRKEDEMAPSKMPSDAAVNVNAEQSSAPTKHQKSLESPAHTPITAVSPQPQSAPEMSAPPKWKAEDVALKYIEKLDAAMARLEFVDVCGSTQVNMERDCQMWKKNFTKNQSDTFPILDATLVKIQNAPDDYVNLSSIKVPHVIHPVLMGQIPKKGCEEDFWKATFQENVVVVYVLVSGGETDKVQFFPNEAGGFIYHGNMFVNIRKVDKMDDERTRFTIEILPNGMSNSNILDVYVHTGWEPFAVPVKYANTTRSVVDMMNFVKSSNGTEKLMILSQNGSGRAGFFVSLGAAFCCLNDLLEPNIVEIVKTIRLQRPHSVASLKQYASLYLCLIYYIKKKCIIPEALKAKLEDVTKALETVIREDLSIMF